MVLDSFISITQRIIEEDGFDDYLPTLLFPDRDHIIVLEDVPLADSHESCAYDWVADRVKAQENFLVAFRIDGDHFKVFGRLDGVTQERTCRVGGT